MKKLIVIDFESILLNNGRNINPYFWAFEAKINQQNALLAIASHRQYFDIIKHFEDVKDRIIIAEGGSYIMQRNQELYAQPLSTIETHKALLKARTLKEVHILLCGKNAAYTEDSNSCFLEEAYRYYHRIVKVDDLLLVDDSICKVALCDFNANENNYDQQLNSFREAYHMTLSANKWLNITALNVNMESAISFLQKNFNITPEETKILGSDNALYEMTKQSNKTQITHKEHAEKPTILNHDNDNYLWLKEEVINDAIINRNSVTTT